LDESIQLLKRLWTEERVTFAGSVFQLHDVSIGYRPAQTPHPPIWVAAAVPENTPTGSEAPLDRAARLGDGWLTAAVDPDQFARALERIQAIAGERYGRKLGPAFRAVFECFINVGKSTDEARREALDFHFTHHRRTFDDETLRRWVVYGRPEECAERLAAYIAAGANAFHLVPAGPDIPAQVQAIARELKPLLTTTTAA
jgi:alkanesulfonate monooxygenase SsuD/methylene tetrahydromethanopterin reductase-like flavin-dependent oxidoreductase (luciferase family)